MFGGTGPWLLNPLTISEVDNRCMELIYVDIRAESCQNMTFFFFEFQKYQETLCKQQLIIVEFIN